MTALKKRDRNRGGLGSWLKVARSARGLTQKDLADAIGLEYYTMVSQMELGYISIPPALWVPLGIALKLDLSEWVTTCLMETQPEVYQALFDDVPPSAVAQNLFRALRAEHDPRVVKMGSSE